MINLFVAQVELSHQLKSEANLLVSTKICKGDLMKCLVPSSFCKFNYPYLGIYIDNCKNYLAPNKYS